MKRKILLVISCLTFLCSLLSACDPILYYHGKHKNLYTEAITSLLGVDGFTIHFGQAPQLDIIEEDSYGRILFLYYEGNKNIKALLVSQKSDNDYVYFYENYNFIAKYEDEKTASNDFSEMEIQKLKSLNDWNLALNKQKFVKEKIVSKKTFSFDYTKQNKETIKKGYGKIASNIHLYDGAACLTTDNEGKMLFLASSVLNNGGYQPYIVLIFNSDWTYNDKTYGLEIKDLYNYQDDLQTFKELNNWKARK